MNKFKIRQKFFILGIVALVYLTLLGSLAFDINKKAFNNLSEVFNDFKEVQNIQSKYIEPLFVLREKNLTLVMSPNKSFKASADKKLLKSLSMLDKSFLNSSKELSSKWQEYKKSLLVTRGYALSGFDEGSFMNVISHEREVFQELVDELKIVQAQKLEASQQTFLEAKKSLSDSEIYIILSFLIIGFGIFVFDFTVIRKTVESIEKVQSGLSKFFVYLANPTYKEGDLCIEIDSKDELGIMARSINRQVKIIKSNLEADYELIKEATTTLQELKDANFGNRLLHDASSNALNTLKNVMNEMIDNLENKIQQEITNRSNQEKILVQQSKLAAMGNMLGNIAHQWRQPISEINAILMEVEAVSRFSKLQKEFLLEKISSCYEVTEHMSDTISDFQNFFKPSKQKETFSVNEACNSAISVVAASLKFHHIDLSVKIDEEHSVYGFPREFSHAILNILSNSKDILVERNIQEPKIFVSIKKGKEYSVIRIEDNAGGIDDKNLERIFEPYFTTKHATQGTGIGLYMTKMIVENSMNGHINVQNSEIGALFTIKIHLK